MARKLNERNIRTLGKTAGGTTYTITLPIDMIRELKWRKGQKLVVEKQGNDLIIKDWKPK